MPPFRIAIDGPAGVGKGTLAKALAEHYDFACLDTGLLYRRFAAKREALAGNATSAEKPISAQEAQTIAANIAAELAKEGETLSPEMRQHLTRPELTQLASFLAALPEVRAGLLGLQKNFAAHPPAGKQGAVLDGRDIASVICPDAEVKFFLTASPETRAQRRLAQMKAQGSIPPSLAEILEAIKQRDKRDLERAHAPLIQHKDAVLLDTDKLGINEMTARAVRVIDAARRDFSQA